MPISDIRGTAGDSIAGAVTQIGSKYVRTTRFAIIGAGASGTVTLPPNSEVVLDDFGGTVDAIITEVSGGKPTVEPARDTAGDPIATSFDALGNWVLVGVPVAYPIAIVYRVRQQLINFDHSSSDIWGPTENETHGEWTGGTLHAIATTVKNGFMSAVDKLKLDGLSGVFGTYYKSVEYTGNSAGAVYPTVTQVGTLTTDNIPAGKYRIFYSIIVSRDSGTGRSIAIVHVQQGGGGPDIPILTKWEEGVTNVNCILVISGHRDVDLIAGVHEVHVELSGTTAAKVNALAGSALSMFRLA